MKIHRVHALAECTQLARMIPTRPPIAIAGTVCILIMLVVGGVTWAGLTHVDLIIRAPARIRARRAPQVSFTSSSGERAFAAAPGRVAEVPVVEGQAVHAGDVLALLDTSQLANDVARLDAALAAAHDAYAAAARMRELAADQFTAAQAARAAELAQTSRDEHQGRSRTRADVEVARSALAAATREVDRLTALERDGAASPSQVEDAGGRLREARAHLDAARAGWSGGRAEVLRRQIDLAERDRAVQAEELSQRESAAAAEVKAAEGRLGNARIELGRGTIHADRDGVVSSVAVGVGDIVQQGQALVTVTPTDGLRVDAAIAAADAAHVRPGMRVRIRLDAFDWQRYGTVGGTIDQVGADAESLPSASGRQVPVYVVRVKLDAETIGRGTERGQLKLGMTGMVEVVTDRERLLTLLLGRLRQAVSP